MPEAAALAAELVEHSPGSPSSILPSRSRAVELLEGARSDLAFLAARPPSSVVFTSGGAEAASLAVKGVLLSPEAPSRVILSAADPAASLHPARSIARLGRVQVEEVPVDSLGRMVPESYRAALAGPRALVCLVLANAEVGTLEEITDRAREAREAGAIVYVDASLTAPVLALPDEAAADLVSISGRLLGGVRGAGALLVAGGVRLSPLVNGGSQESGFRGGEENLPAIAAMGAAARIVAARRETIRAERGEAHRRLFALLEKIPGVTPTGDRESRLAGHASCLVEGAEAEALLIDLDAAGVQAAGGSPCLAVAGKPSPVLLAMGIPPRAARGALVFSAAGRLSPNDAARAAAALAASAARLRALSGRSR